MTTLVIVLAVAVLVAAGVFFVIGRRNGKHGLRRRFGPEYDRVVARHDGDTRAAEHELNERLKRHGSLEERTLTPQEREEYLARWARVQDRFVDAPQQAVAEADALLAELARDLGFPDGTDFGEQADALSVHHAHHVHAYRRVHAARRGEGGTEELRTALVEARGLFDVLVSNGTGRPAHRDEHHAEGRGRA
ncbi:hypothetical protein MHW47_09730 [Streptomyces sp. OfavH-34-F]|uniref:hypothetical protein n=1 Tax=Streptomyces sp. OfavH-34-F TaxID=2917760 RepID=UPI001EF2DE1C|nr:hypothetical protein [Streptomyces sp. OfavH-34-F]MCG7524715.1 hypothetical protein [Streptomyces sp. OfavH-34-F]